jgi:hypothetical protein
MANARFIQVASDPDSHLEVLEAFRFGGQAREFNVRLRRGVAPTDEALIAALRKEFAIPSAATAIITPLAGDRNVVFQDAAVPLLTAGRSDTHGMHPRPAELPPPSAYEEVKGGGWVRKDKQRKEKA